MSEIPLIDNKDLPINRQNLGLGPAAKPEEVKLIKGKIEDY